MENMLVALCLVSKLFLYYYDKIKWPRKITKKTNLLSIYSFKGLEIKNIMARNMASDRKTWCGSRSVELTSWNTITGNYHGLLKPLSLSPSDTCPVTRPHVLILPKYFYLLGTNIQTWIFGDILNHVFLWFILPLNFKSWCCPNTKVALIVHHWISVSLVFMGINSL